MTYALLLADPSNTASGARVTLLTQQILKTSPGGGDVSVAFRPNRADDLYASAKSACQLGYDILHREGIVRSQLVIRYQLDSVDINVVGRSADLLFALALIDQVFQDSASEAQPTRSVPVMAATGVVASDGTIQRVEHIASKLRAACVELASSGAIVFLPADNAGEVDLDALKLEYPRLSFLPVRHLDEALEHLGIVLERVYLRNPFRGLEYFDYEHRAIFFGRDLEIRHALEQLIRREAAGVPGLLVEGASGSGKSSFLRAGVLPALVNPSNQERQIENILRTRPVRSSVRGAIWRMALLPGESGETRMAQSVFECWKALPELAALPAGDCSSFEALAAWRKEHWPSSQRFVWLIDQFEELFSLGFSDSAIEALGSFLRRLQVDGVWTLLSIRADAVPVLKRNATLREVFGSNEGQYYLPAMSGTALDDVIARPARAAGVSFALGATGVRLDQLLREESYRKQENALPLLEFTLHELYERRAGQELQYEEYNRLGGLAGSIGTTAEGAFLIDPENSERVAPRVFRSLVSVDDEGRAARRYALIDEISNDPSQKALLDRFIAARLCVTDSQGGLAVVAFAHEALLRTWPRLTNWLAVEGTLLQARDVLVSEAKRWEQRAELRDWLVTTPHRLASIRSVIDSGIPIPAVAARFASQSEQRASRSKRVSQALIASIGVLAVVAALFGFYFQREHTAASRAIGAQFEAKSWALLRAGEWLTGVRYALASTTLPGTSGADTQPLLSAAVQQVRGIRILSGHSATVRTAVFSPAGSRSSPPLRMAPRGSGIAHQGARSCS